MSVMIRLARYGAKKRPFYRVVATDKRSRRDGRFIELLGTYDPNQSPSVVDLKMDRVDYWLGVGALPSATVGKLLRQIRVEAAAEESA